MSGTEGRRDGPKTEPATIREKHRTVDRIREALERQSSFLVLGHREPDEDCIASMVAFSLLVSKFNGRATILVGTSMEEHQRYLLNICTYNSIRVLSRPEQLSRPVGVIVALDTPKPELLEFGEELSSELEDPDTLKIEVDHHLGGDSAYIGSPGCRLVAGASSTCELVGYLLMKLERDRELLDRNQIRGLFTRNIVLSILTGIVADSRMGKYLKSRKERWFYDWFSTHFEHMLEVFTERNKGNFASIDELFGAMETVSDREGDCYAQIMARPRSKGRVSWVALDERESAELFRAYPAEMIASVSKSVSDALAERSGAVGLVAYYDDPSASDFAQFRMRRAGGCDSIDLRVALENLGVENGGGHPGAVGFRFPRGTVPDIAGEAERIANEVDRMIPRARSGA